MKAASVEMEFEKAAAILRTIRQIEHVIASNNLVVSSATKDCDALALYRQADEVILMQLFFREGNLIGSEHYPFSNVLENDQNSWNLLFYNIINHLPYFPLKSCLVPSKLKLFPKFSLMLTTKKFTS